MQTKSNPNLSTFSKNHMKKMLSYKRGYRGTEGFKTWAKDMFDNMEQQNSGKISAERREVLDNQARMKFKQWLIDNNHPLPAHFWFPE